LTRINFSESYQLLAHLKTVRLFVESVLRYGLPADYAGVVVKPDPKTASRTLKALQDHFGYLAAASQAPNRGERGKGKGKAAGAGGVGEEVGGEWAGVMEQEYFDFVLFEVPEVPV
jgi:V-type H+-transporting ATPase subunit C